MITDDGNHDYAKKRYEHWWDAFSLFNVAAGYIVILDCDEQMILHQHMMQW